MAASEEIVQIIKSFGFTDLESEIYVFLLQHSPATGYKIAKGIGRSFTNTYKALAGLENKGAILVDEEKSRLSRAVPIEELMDQMEARFREQRKQAIAAANRLPLSPSDRRVYHLASVDQVYERFRCMLKECEERALMELFPGPCAVLGEAVEETARRGIRVAARVYAGEHLDGVQVIQSPFGDENLETWRSQWLALFIDGRQFLLGHLSLDGKGVYEAVWSANPFIARAFYSYVNSDLHHYSFAPLLETASATDTLRKEYDLLQDEFPVEGDLGFRDLAVLFPSE
jgi:predicted transcriptional regulator